METTPCDLRWPAGGATRVPYRVFSDPAIYQMEQEKIFRGPIWHYLCLTVEVKNPGDIRTTWIGDTPIIVTRDENGELHGMVNRCAHKGALVCLKERDNKKSLTCVYHAWNYKLDGQLRGVAFQKGVKGKGGMPEDFDVSKHRLQPIRVSVVAGIVFGTFSDEAPPLEEFLGDRITAFLKRNMDHPLKILGTHSQMIHNNWKLYAENVRDSYHATLLHTFYTTFKVNRLDMDGGIILSEKKWHHISYSKRATLDAAAEYTSAEVHSAKYSSELDGPQLLQAWDGFDDQITHSIQTIFPTLVSQLTLNSLAVRFVVPRGVDKTELYWVFLGYETDTPEQEKMRVMQANLTGAAGLVALEDGCINSFVQRGTRGSDDKASFIEMGGKLAESNESSRATEAAVRGFWHGYQTIMGFHE
ncbi:MULTISPECIES: aromatic ring-hydroxylating oxygenase subunit alpha [Hydrogenophaga]|jgi:anthranilate 1,2-dioxygenase large subunit|uniref:Rieske (2Fe-2S) iron-sulfur domain protein n=1 Tax=Hydrogenophaga intermedia TaxID=65786 RepID=A0A1L1PCQ2_HYDIT|nr:MULTISPECIES: Rieske 2Fe-2S domain-containing protein [Hydrogenophaga]AOS78741.1 Rieske (2Fe-2S) protein [Hydrogenophaga sp. PBC]TMU73831.1 Rieske 2Fe-2S domain-containing protein [Hydrogenophaga intermedia]CDN87748.1 Rieske (2Fe-2S) iron-sulfur domain protein [Hydrogenophaga intermedia]